MTAVLLPAPLLAQDADICRQFAHGIDFSIEVTQVSDVGQGMVRELSTGSDGTSGSDRISFQQCASGQAITAVMSAWDENGSVLAPANAYDIMMMAMESATAYSMSDIVRQMTDAGVEAELMTLTRETCGCAAFYPELRGDKAPWSAS